MLEALHDDVPVFTVQIDTALRRDRMERYVESNRVFDRVRGEFGHGAVTEIVGHIGWWRGKESQIEEHDL